MFCCKYIFSGVIGVCDWVDVCARLADHVSISGISYMYVLHVSEMIIRVSEYRWVPLPIVWPPGLHGSFA